MGLILSEENTHKNVDEKGQKIPESNESKMNIGPPLGLSIIFSVIGSIILMLVRMISDMDISRMYTPLFAFPLGFLAITVIFPKKLKAPFGETDAKTFVKNIGLYVPDNFGKNVMLGLFLGLCTLTGMLFGSIFTGRYVFNLGQLELTQVIFATAPGVWDEVFFRGVITFLLLYKLKNLPKAIIIQSLIFGIAHIYSFQFWAIVDIFSIVLMGLAFSYVAYKTNSLIPAIIFHYIHDAFIFLVQTPDAAYHGVLENIGFFLSLWIMLGLGCLITRYLVVKIDIAQDMVLYDLAKMNP